MHQLGLCKAIVTIINPIIIIAIIIMSWLIILHNKGTGSFCSDHSPQWWTIIIVY